MHSLLIWLQICTFNKGVFVQLQHWNFSLLKKKEVTWTLTRNCCVQIYPNLYVAGPLPIHELPVLSGKTLGQNQGRRRPSLSWKCKHQKKIRSNIENKLSISFLAVSSESDPWQQLRVSVNPNWPRRLEGWENLLERLVKMCLSQLLQILASNWERVYLTILLPGLEHFSGSHQASPLFDGILLSKSKRCEIFHPKYNRPWPE